MLKLTETGLAQLQKMREITRGKIAKILAEVSPEELVRMSAVFSQLEQVFSKQVSDN